MVNGYIYDEMLIEEVDPLIKVSIFEKLIPYSSQAPYSIICELDSNNRILTFFR